MNIRIVVRALGRASDGTLRQVLEQEIPATKEAVFLLLRRLPFRSAVASELLSGGTLTFEVKASRLIRPAAEGKKT